MKGFGWARAIGALVAGTYRRGGRAMIAAPLLVALAVVPEAAQHVVEMRLGMFESVAAFRAHAADPLRWAFGYAKVAGLVLAMLAVARYWAVGSTRRALLIGPLTILKAVAVIVIGSALAWPLGWMAAHTTVAVAKLALQTVSVILQAGVLLYLAAVLIDERAPSPRRTVDLLPAALVTMALLVAAFVPAQFLHQADHKIAIGRPIAVVAPLMAFDSLVVGLLAALVGSALYLGYRSGLTWRGWSVSPASLER